MSDCLIEFCTAGFSSSGTFCSTDFVLLAGITFGVELYVPWDSPEAVVDISSEGVVPLRNLPDCRGVDQNFHDVTIVDMGEVLESSVSIPELLALSQQWPPALISHMGWRQKELEEMRSAAKQRFRQSRPSSCVYCGSLIKCDMYRQLWWCQVSWKAWKGTPQDCMDQLRGAHDVPWEVKSASLEKYLPP